jgi:hypothetical protein
MLTSSRTVIGLLAALLLALAAGGARAEGLSWTESQQRLQQDRIDWQGSQGQISPYEQQRLSGNADRIDRLQNSARRDGQLDLIERGRLGSTLDHQNRAIYNLPNQ